MAKKYNKKKVEGVFWKYFFPFILALAGVITYLAAPQFISFGLKVSQGILGLMVLGSIALLLWAHFFFVMKIRGKTMLYCIAVILFTMMCIWLLANREMVFSWMDQTLGVWGTTGVLLVFCLAVGIFIYCFL